ncbi:hypothetical protein I4F81_001269 [Pyropia yezoensis]|uniref:Uncharacterized protein n=1 Tax=Pyropia yezoensis TaxID=2788 RepID=A0ACC3BL70_PYRYE|nr:hypothetical protein I4F81_001269 [Neopyropia yezoensis]
MRVVSTTGLPAPRCTRWSQSGTGGGPSTAPASSGGDVHGSGRRGEKDDDTETEDDDGQQGFAADANARRTTDLSDRDGDVGDGDVGDACDGTVRDACDGAVGDERDDGVGDAPTRGHGQAPPVAAKDRDSVSNVRVQVLKRWHDEVHRRATRHGTRGKAQQLHVANVSTHLDSEDPYMKERAIAARACARLIENAVKVSKKCAAIRAQSTGMSADDVTTAVEGFLTKQAGHWRASTEDVDSIMEYVTATLPLVGGVQRGEAPPFCGAPPDDAPPESVDLVAGGGGGAAESDGRGRGAVSSVEGGPDEASDAGAEAGALSGWAEGARSVGQFPAAAGASQAVIGPVAGTGASGRSVRAAVADNALEAIMPGAGSFLTNMSKAMADSSR